MLTSLRLTSLLVLLNLPAPSLAQVSPLPIIAMGLVSGKGQCAKQFPEARTELDSAFETFIQKNKKYFDAETWRKMGELSFPAREPIDRKQCDQLLHELPNLNADLLLDRVARESACQREANVTYQKIGPTRPMIGIDYVERSIEPRVLRVRPSSPAERAGLRPGDLVTHFNGARVETSCELSLAVLKSSSGVNFAVKVVRDGVEVQLKVMPVLVRDDE